MSDTVNNRPEVNNLNYLLYFQAFQEEEYADRRDFVSNHPLFSKWSPKFRHLLEMSLRREVFTFDTTIVKQGGEFGGLYFMRK
jgi:hypothetical protein